MLVIVPRYRAAEYASLAKEFEGVPGSQVVLDRRNGERRRGQGIRDLAERRFHERRTGQMEDSQGLVVVFLC